MIPVAICIAILALGTLLVGLAFLLGRQSAAHRGQYVRYDHNPLDRDSPQQH